MITRRAMLAAAIRDTVTKFSEKNSPTPSSSVDEPASIVEDELDTDRSEGTITELVGGGVGVGGLVSGGVGV